MNSEEVCKNAVANGEYNSMADCMDAVHGVKGGKRRRTTKHKSHRRKTHKRHTRKRHTHRRRTHHRRR
jgi:hypothetical protein